MQTGDPDGPDGPLVGFGQDGDAKKGPRRVPLELFVDGDAKPTRVRRAPKPPKAAPQALKVAMRR